MTKPAPPRTPSALKLHITQAEWEQLYKNGLIQAKVKGTSKVRALLDSGAASRVSAGAVLAGVMSGSFK